ncbi:hypothetical protein EC973_004146 [Apophysomyces ossiformis]|uniref:Uncharacterized protein n=1 Tax=Apophysomyces ossiformis TaxID=679940 RepID=A0A8H7BKV2_9FUNG|nr:hypothetical protein EC973_004146 [Apophysomyces ossiformis]
MSKSVESLTDLKAFLQRVQIYHSTCNAYGYGQYKKLEGHYFDDNINKVDAAAAASIFNDVDGKTFQVGLRDANGESYLTMSLDSKYDIDFTFNAEFAVLPVGDTVQDQSKMVTGHMHRPWFSFKLVELTSEQISFTFDGQELKKCPA